MQYTEEYNLKKPEITDPILVQDMNDNMDIIAEELSKRHSLKVPTYVINNGDDLDTYKTTGEYNCATGAIAKSLLNCPYTNTGFKLTVEYLSYTGHLKQSIEGAYSNGVWFRTMADGVTWGEWQKVSNVEYEEGTWTPMVVHPQQSSVTCTTIGKYFKVGKCVHIKAEFTFSSAISSLYYIQGLPFAPKSNKDIIDVLWGATRLYALPSTDRFIISGTSGSVLTITLHGFYETSE